MANFLISTMPATGHVNPGLPIATELVARGHRVAWHTGPAYRSAVEATGVSFIPFDRTPDFEQLRVEPDPGASGLAAGISVMRRLLVDRVPGQVADYRQILQRFAADVVVADMCSLGAATLRDLGGPPFATLGINPLVTLDPEVPPFGSGRGPARGPLGRLRNRISHGVASRLFLSKVLDLLNAERAKLGLDPLPGRTRFDDLQRSPFLHVMPTTLAFEYPRARLGAEIAFVGPLLPPPAPEFVPPVWWPELDGRRVVHVTQGTYATDAADLIKPTVEALADAGLLLVVTSRDHAALGSLPGNARTASFIPHGHLLPKVDAMVTNAGYNGVLTGLANGVPLVCAGQTEDKAEVSARVAWSGAGIDLRTATPSAAQVRSAVDRVLSDASYRRHARLIQSDFARHDGPREASDLLERVATTGHPITSTGRGSATQLQSPRDLRRPNETVA
jgi:UDP:flavonoid glycosyltransferase YjiC (YdhE family)